jgi:UDP-glucose 4-epimerase
LASVPRSVAQPLDTHAACATGTLNVLDASRQSGVRRVVYAASSSAYGDQPVPVKTETLLPAPISPYAAAKLAGEFYCQAFTATYGLETVALRYFNVFGPRQDPQGAYAAVIPKFIVEMLARRQPTIFGDGKQSRDFVYVGDVVRANLLAAESAKAVGKVINIASGRQYSLLEVLAAINQVLGTEIKPVLAAPRVGDVRDSLADISRARELLDYEPSVSFEEGLRRTVEDFRASTRESRK